MRLRAGLFGVMGLALAPRADAGPVINEILADPAGLDANCDGTLNSTDDEFVEIVNVGDTVVDLSDATLSDGGGVKYTFPVGTELQPYDAVVVFARGAAVFDGTATTGDPWCVALPPEVTVLVSGVSLSLNNGGDAVILKDAGGNVLDEHTYGSEADHSESIVRDPELVGTTWIRHPGVPLSPGTMADGSPFGPPDSGDPGDTDTDEPGDTDTDEPGDTADTDVEGTTGELVLNELLPDPTGTDAGHEWVEVLNVGASSVQLAGWTIERATSSYALWFTFPAGELAPGERLVVGGEHVAVADLQISSGAPDLGNAGTSGDAVRLVDPFGAVIDTVIYGNNNSDGFLDDHGAVATSFAPKPTSGMALARIPDGEDSDDSGVDFILASPSPGLENLIDTGVPLDTGETGNPASGPSPFAGSVLVNEFLPDPAGADAGFEWIELVVVSGPVDLDGWKIERATNNWSARYTFGPLPLDAGDRLVIGESDVMGATITLAPGETLNLGNATSSGDAVRLVDADGLPVDTVIYGPDNSDGFLDDDGLVAFSVAPAPMGDASLARVPDGVDTNDSGVDFLLITAPTLGAANVDPADLCANGGDAAGVVINELDATTTDLEWVEVHNTRGQPVDLSGWRLEWGTSSFNGGAQIPSGTTIPAGGYLLVGELAGADLVAELALGNATNNSDGVRLVDCVGGAVDTVIYGAPNSDGWLDDSGLLASSTAPKPVSGHSLARIPNGADSDASGADFQVIRSPTPGAENIAPADLCSNGGGAEGVVINELDPATASAEWVEIYNGSGGSVDLSDWTLAYGTQSFSSRVPIPAGTTLAAGDFLLIGAVEGADLGAELSMGNATSSSDGVRLEDCVGGVVDTVIYGSPNSDEFVDDSGEVAASLAPKPVSGSSLARIQDGFDTDRAGDDFLLQAQITPGASNPLVEPVVCEPSAGGVTINEVLPNPKGADEGFEWIELYNSGPEDASVAGWAVHVGTKNFDTATFTLPGGTRVPAGGWLVIGGLAVPEADVTASFSLGNGTGGDGVRIVDCEGTSVDTVIYGKDGADGLPDDNGVPADPYGDPGEGQSIARVVDGVDSDLAEDWDTRSSPTPGASNVLAGGGGGSAAPAGCGCSKRDKAPGDKSGAAGKEPGQGGCSTVPLPLGGLEVLVAFVAVRRRRRE